MGTKSDSPSVDHNLVAVADRQSGVLTRDQLAHGDLSAHGIHERVRTKRLLRVHRGVYALGHKRLHRNGYVLAAVLACGEGAVLSHATAAEQWNNPGKRISVGRRDRALERRWRAPQRNPRPPLRTPRLRGRTVKDGIPISTVARALLDPGRRSQQPSAEASHRRIGVPTTVRPNRPYCCSQRESGKTRRKGSEARKGPTARDPVATREPLSGVLRAPQHPRAAHQPAPARLRSRAFWPQANLVVELDGYPAHGSVPSRPRTRPSLTQRRLSPRPRDRST